MAFQISGPVDLAQLQLENAELLEILQSKNRKVRACKENYLIRTLNIIFEIFTLSCSQDQYIFQVIEERDVISSTRRKKNRKRQKLESEEERWEKLNKQKT